VEGSSRASIASEVDRACRFDCHEVMESIGNSDLTVE
jgi:hypothetical protein